MKEWRATVILLGGGDPRELETDDPAELLEGLELEEIAVVSFAHVGAVRQADPEPAVRGRTLAS